MLERHHIYFDMTRYGGLTCNQHYKSYSLSHYVKKGTLEAMSDYNKVIKVLGYCL